MKKHEKKKIVEPFDHTDEMLAAMGYETCNYKQEEISYPDKTPWMIENSLNALEIRKDKCLEAIAGWEDFVYDALLEIENAKESGKEVDSYTLGCLKSDRKHLQQAKLELREVKRKIKELKAKKEMMKKNSKETIAA